MNTRELASAILKRRLQLTNFLQAGTLQAELGREGFSEAMRRGWIEPNYEFGALQITNSLAKLEEIRNCEEDQAPDIGDSVVVAENGKSYTGTIQSRRPGGRLVISFPPENRPTVQRDYDQSEVRPMGKVAATGAPNSPLTQLTPQTAGPSATKIPYVS